MKWSRGKLMAARVGDCARGGIGAPHLAQAGLCVLEVLADAPPLVAEVAKPSRSISPPRFFPKCISSVIGEMES